MHADDDVLKTSHLFANEKNDEKHKTIASSYFLRKSYKKDEISPGFIADMSRICKY